MKLFTQILVLIKFYQIVFGSDQQNKLNMSYIESYPVAGRAPDGNRDPYFCHDIKKFNMKKEFMGFCICEKWDPLTLRLNGFPMGKRDSEIVLNLNLFSSEIGAFLRNQKYLDLRVNRSVV